MIQCTESWFLADSRGLALFYGSGFRLGDIPLTGIETIAKDEVYAILERATGQSKKGKYVKSHGFQILGLVDPAKGRKRFTIS